MGLICIGNRMNLSAFRDSPTACAILRTFKTSRVTINHEMHKQVHMIFYLLYSRQNYSIFL